MLALCLWMLSYLQKYEQRTVTMEQAGSSVEKERNRKERKKGTGKKRKKKRGKWVRKQVRLYKIRGQGTHIVHPSFQRDEKKTATRARPSFLCFFSVSLFSFVCLPPPDYCGVFSGQWTEDGEYACLCRTKQRAAWRVSQTNSFFFLNYKQRECNALNMD